MTGTLHSHYVSMLVETSPPDVREGSPVQSQCPCRFVVFVPCLDDDVVGKNTNGNVQTELDNSVDE